MSSGAVGNKTMKSDNKPSKNPKRTSKSVSIRKKCKFIICQFLRFRECKSIRKYGKNREWPNLPNRKKMGFSYTFETSENEE